MAAKKSAMEKMLQRAERVLSGYVKSGRRSAEATVDELVRVLDQARTAVAGGKRKPARSKATGRKTARRKTSARAGTSTTAKRRTSAAKRTAAKGRGAAARRK
jgi:hypothetical protein